MILNTLNLKMGKAEINQKKQLKRFKSQYESVSKKYISYITELLNQLKITK